MDLSTRYLGLTLRSPLLAAASPLSRNVDGVRRLADTGVGAVVLHSLFEEQLRREAEQNARLAAQGNETYAESLTYFPSMVDQGYRANRYLHLLESAASTVDIPVIGSLNGVTPGGWARYAGSMQNAGATEIKEAAITDGMLTLRMDAWMKVMKGITTTEQMIRETTA